MRNFPNTYISDNEAQQQSAHFLTSLEFSLISHDCRSFEIKEHLFRGLSKNISKMFIQCQRQNEP